MGAKVICTLSSSQIYWEVSIVSKTLGGRTERLKASKSSTQARELVSFVVEGSGYTDIDDKRFDWKSHTFCIPAKYQYYAESHETVYLHRLDDKPMLKALGFYQIEGMDLELLVS